MTCKTSRRFKRKSRYFSSDHLVKVTKNCRKITPIQISFGDISLSILHLKTNRQSSITPQGMKKPRKCKGHIEQTTQVNSVPTDVLSTLDTPKRKVPPLKKGQRNNSANFIQHSKQTSLKTFGSPILTRSSKKSQNPNINRKENSKCRLRVIIKDCLTSPVSVSSKTVRRKNSCAPNVGTKNSKRKCIKQISCVNSETFEKTSKLHSPKKAIRSKCSEVAKQSKDSILKTNGLEGLNQMVLPQQEVQCIYQGSTSNKCSELNQSKYNLRSQSEKTNELSSLVNSCSETRDLPIDTLSSEVCSGTSVKRRNHKENSTSNLTSNSTPKKPLKNSSQRSTSNKRSELNKSSYYLRLQPENANQQESPVKSCNKTNNLPIAVLFSEPHSSSSVKSSPRRKCSVLDLTSNSPTKKPTIKKACAMRKTTGIKVNETDAEVNTGAEKNKNCNDKSKKGCGKLKNNNRKQTTDNMLVKKDIVCSPNANIRKSKRLTLLQSSKMDQFSTPINSRRNGHAGDSILNSSPILNSTPRNSRNVAIDDLDMFNNTFSIKKNKFSIRTKSTLNPDAAHISESVQGSFQTKNCVSNKSKKKIEKPKSLNSKEAKLDLLSKGTNVKQNYSEVGTAAESYKNCNGKSKNGGGKLKKNSRKQTADDMLVKNDMFCSPNSNVRKSKRLTLLQSSKMDKFIMSTPIHPRTSSQSDGRMVLSSSPILNSSSPRNPRNVAIDDLYMVNNSFNIRKSSSNITKPTLHPGASSISEVIQEPFQTEKCASNEAKMKKTKSRNMEEAGSDSLSKGSKNKVPAKGSLKRKRWVMNALNEKNEGYEDDIFESQKYENFNTIFKSFDEESDGHASLISIATPKCGFIISPCLKKRSPLYKDCISAEELREARKAAEEYIHRRNKKRKSDTHKESTSRTPISLTKNEDKYLPEKRKLDYIETVNNIISVRKDIQRDIEKLTQDESEEEDAYFSDVSS